MDPLISLPNLGTRTYTDNKCILTIDISIFQVSTIGIFNGDIFEVR